MWVGGCMGAMMCLYLGIVSDILIFRDRFQKGSPQYEPQGIPLFKHRPKPEWQRWAQTWKEIFKVKIFLVGLLGLFFIYFLCFQAKTIQTFTIIKCEKCSYSILWWDSNSQPLEHDSSPVTTRPGLPGENILLDWIWIWAIQDSNLARWVYYKTFKQVLIQRGRPKCIQFRCLPLSVSRKLCLNEISFILYFSENA